MARNKRNARGITLIALVITIIVLLILAGVTIAALSGDNGILKRATEAKKGTNQSTVEEITKLSINGLITDNLGDTSTITPEVLANRIKKDYNRTDVTAEDSEFPTNIIFEKESLKVPVDIKLSVGSAEKNIEGIYSADIDESKIAPQDLFIYEPISTGSNNKIASTGDMSTLPLKEARIIGIKPQYCNGGGYNKTTDQKDLNDTNYKINYEGITDTLIVPYQVEIDGEMYKVTEVNLTVTGISSDHFRGSVGLPSIENIIYPDTVKKIVGVSMWDNGKYTEESVLKTCILPNKITEIPESLFKYNKKLTEINIPNGVTKIGDAAFSKCSGLASIKIPNGVTEIGVSAFNECSGLASINIPNGVTEIGDDAFYECSSLASINIPNGVTEIGNNAFNKCSSLASINIPNGVTKIGYGAFYKCSGLTSINIPNEVTEIGYNAFRECSSLASVTYKGNTYTSKSAIKKALTDAKVTLNGGDIFSNTNLSD